MGRSERLREMRLGDLDALRNRLQSRYDNGEDEFDRGFNLGIAAAIELIDSAPTVKPCENCDLYVE
ncbi:MAG: hypothetical protein J6Y02_20995 [Pseudobutyrivibrio sp.]|nr:hypothetical protein [Pseudobutyrivibrio sp.]